MFSKDVLIGLFIGIANCDVQIESDYRSTLGYQVKPKIQIRGELMFLKQIERTLLQHSVKCHVKEIESKVRQKPILTISRIKDLVIISDMIPLEFFDARTQWFTFRTVINIMYEKRHLTLEGLDEILKIKGLI
tara:strand:- start:401 stop:799 length:399 start_codon:yes stop_codon:yes gene_type:complete